MLNRFTSGKIWQVALLTAVITFFTGCKHYDNPIEEVLSSSDSRIKKVVDSLENYRLQILFTEVHRTEDNKVSFTDYSFQADDSTYFYPASTVKFPVSVLALEKLDRDSLMNRDTRFFVSGDTLETTFANEIYKIFTISDNVAFNRLFEYLGQDAINEGLNQKGIKASIFHRLSVDNSDDLTTKPLIYHLNDTTIASTDEIVNHPLEPLQMQGLILGKGYIADDSLIVHPKDFSRKNYLPLSSLHNVMKQLLFPESYPYEKQFHLSDADRNFLLETMKIGPGRPGYPSLNSEGTNKLLVLGDIKGSMPETLDIYNKTGGAYGYLTDCAYIVDRKNNKEWIITATIYVNTNGIFNDDVYDYDSIGIPFLAELGRQLIRF